MIDISETAMMVLSESLRASRVEREMGLRLKEEGNRLTLELDRPKKEDRVISQNGQKVLIIGPGFEDRFGNSFIDVEETSDGPDLVMRSSE